MHVVDFFYLSVLRLGIRPTTRDPVFINIDFVLMTRVTCWVPWGPFGDHFGVLGDQLGVSLDALGMRGAWVCGCMDV